MARIITRPFWLHHIHLVLLGAATLVSGTAYGLLAQFDTVRLALFGPTARLYLLGMKQGLILSTTLLAASFVVMTLFTGPRGDRAIAALHSWWESLSSTRRNALVLATCLVFAFAAHGANVTHAYFQMDDFIVLNMNNLLPFSEAVMLVHGNDHTLPLFRAEMKALYTLFGTNEAPYSAFVFILFALIPFFVYLTFQRLKIGLPYALAFLALFSGATGWAVLGLSGLYIMSIYPQAILFFTIAIWSYTAWKHTRSTWYLPVFGLALMGALTIDIAGIWTVPVVFAYMLFLEWYDRERFVLNKAAIFNFLKNNRPALAVFATVVILFGTFLFYTFTHIQPGTFLSSLNGQATDPTLIENSKAEQWRPIPLALNAFTLFTSGVSLTLFAPNVVKILAHPALHDKVQWLWPIVELAVLMGNILLAWFAWRYAQMKERKFIVFLGLGMLVTIGMIILGRPDHSIIPDFDYRYAGPAFYFYCIFLSISTLFVVRTHKHVGKVVAAIIIILFCAQQAFSFHAMRLREEAVARKAHVVSVVETLLPELDTLSARDPSLTIPDLSASHIDPAMLDFYLSNAILFAKPRLQRIHLIQNTAMPPDVESRIVKTVESIRTDTSPVFIDALKEPGAIRSYYTSPALIAYTNLPLATSSTPHTQKSDAVIIRKGAFDPEQLHTLEFTLSTADIAGNVEISVMFTNDIDVTGATARIRIDDYTPFTRVEGKRKYHIETDLLQIYPYALSQKVSDLTLHLPEAKSPTITEVTLK
jgi:hypothetical protein